MDARPEYYNCKVEEIRDRARRLYGRIIRRGPMELEDVWHWIAQELDVDKDDARIEQFDAEQLVHFIGAARSKIEEYKHRGKWAYDYPRRDAPWD